MVRKNTKYGYYLITIIFSILTIIEITIYMKMYSNILGVIYLFINFFMFFMLFTMSVNYSKADKNIRLSKSIVVILLGIISSFVISLLIPYIVSYVDSSFVFENKIFLISKILKPIVYLLLALVSVIDANIKFKNINFVNKKKPISQNIVNNLGKCPKIF